MWPCFTVFCAMQWLSNRTSSMGVRDVYSSLPGRARSPHAENLLPSVSSYATGECLQLMAARLRLSFTSRIGVMMVRRVWISMHQGAPKDCGLENNEKLLDLQSEPRYSQSICLRIFLTIPRSPFWCGTTTTILNCPTTTFHDLVTS
jgi:hypothetical protein